MSPYSLPPLITVLVSLCLGVFILLKGRKLATTLGFILACVTTAWWQGSWTVIFNVESEKIASHLVKIGYSGIIFIPFTFYHFIVYWVGLEKEKTLVRIFYIIGVVFLSILWTSKLLIAGYYKYPWGYYPRAGLLHPLYLTALGAVSTRGLWVLGRALSTKELAPIQRSQFKYTFTSFAIYALASSDFVVNYGVNFYPSGFIFVIISLSLAAFAIIKYGLMDLDLVWRYGLSYFFYSVVTLLAFVPFAFFFRQSLWGVLVVIFLAILVIPYSHRYLIKFFQPVMLGKKYSYLSIMSEFWEGVGVVYTSEQLGWTTVPALAKFMGLSSCSLLIFDRDEMAFVAKAQVGLDEVFGSPELLSIGLGKIDPYDPLIRYLIKTKKIINREELAAEETEENHQVLATMDKIKAQIVVPLFAERRLTAILNLGPKQSGDMFHEQDIDMLKHFARMTENHLAHIVFLEKSVFYSGNIAHDIRSPFKAGLIYDYLEDIRKGLNDPSQRKIAREAVDELERRIKSIHKMSELMVDIYASLERFVEDKFKPERMNYNKKVTDTTKPFLRQAEEDGLALELLLPKRPVFVYAEVMDVERILNELLTNAFKYTTKGKITIEVLQENPQEVLTKITDTGCGIPEDKLRLIFEPFRRLKEGMDKEGIGIGLASVRRLVEANGGRIWVKSKPNQGSDFCFVLPSAEAQKGGTEDV